LSPSIHCHTYLAPDVALHARPGQFVHIRVSGGSSPLLRRPLSILDADRDAGTFRILFKVVGVGTDILAQTAVGTTLDLLGPLGTPFTMPVGEPHLCLVAGGIGMVPLHFMAKELSRLAAPSARPGRIDYFFGARSSDEIYLLDDLRQWCDRVDSATDDGSLGYHGRVTALAEPTVRSASAVYTCGPNPMMADLQRRIQAMDFAGRAEAAMESFMGCGLGACLGCVVTTSRGYERVCTEGPAFALADLRF